MQRKLIHLYDKQFHVVWQDIRAPNEKNPDCYMTGARTKLQLVQEIWSLFFTLYSLFESHIKVHGFITAINVWLKAGIVSSLIGPGDWNGIFKRQKSPPSGLHLGSNYLNNFQPLRHSPP